MTHATSLYRRILDLVYRTCVLHTVSCEPVTRSLRLSDCAVRNSPEIRSVPRFRLHAGVAIYARGLNESQIHMYTCITISAQCSHHKSKVTVYGGLLYAVLGGD